MNKLPVWLRMLICAGVCIAAAAILYLFPPLLIVVVAFAAAMGAAWGYVYAVPVLAAYCLAFAASAAKSVELCCIVAECVLLLPVLTIFLRKKVSHRYTLLAAAVIITVGSYFSLTLDSVLAGDAPSAGLVEELKAFSADVIRYYTDMGFNAVDLNGYFTSLIEVIPDVLMTITMLYGEIVAFCVLMLTRMFCKALNAELRPMAPFYRWRLPQSTIGGVVFMAVVCAALFIFKASVATSFSFSIAVPFITMFAMQGLSFVFYIFNRTKVRVYGYILVVCMLILMFPYSLLFVLPIGVIEQIKNRRQVFDAAARQMELEAQRKAKLNEYDKYGYIRHDDDSNENDTDKK